MGYAPRKENLPMAVCNGPNRTGDISLSATRLFNKTTGAMPAINTVLAAMTRTLVESSDAARLALAVDAQQYFVHQRGSAGIVCYTPIVGSSGSQDANGNWCTVRAIGVKFNDDILPDTTTPREALRSIYPTKAEFLWQASFRSSVLTVPADHIASPTSRPTHAANLWFCDITFLDEDNAATENIIDLTRSESVRVRGSYAAASLSLEFDGGDFDYIVFTGVNELPTNEAGAAAECWGGIITEI